MIPQSGGGGYKKITIRKTFGGGMRGMYQVIRAIISLLKLLGPRHREKYDVYMPPDSLAMTMPAPAPAQFRIRYMDADGQRTRRNITIHPFSSTPRNFSAYCHLRKATRTFLFDRIVEVIDLNTGEVLPHADFFRRVHKRSRLP